MTMPRFSGGATRPARLLSAPWILIASGALATCTGDPDREIPGSRVVESRGAVLHASSAMRFGFTQQHDHEADEPQEQAEPFDYEVPEGWQRQPPTQFRNLNFRVGGERGVDCYLTILTGGGEAANINRWRGQMALDPLDEEGLRSLPRRDFLGSEGVLAEFRGSFQGPGGPEAGAAHDSTLLGIYAQFPRLAISVKMIGPAEQVVVHREDFLRFCDSLRFRELDSGAGPAEASSAGGASKRSEPGQIRYDVPEGWAPGEGSSMRLVTLRVLARPGAECWVTVLRGAAGGVLDNLNRWRREMGQDPLSEAAVGELSTVEVFGRTAPFLQVEGPVAEGGGASYLFGVIAEHAGNRVFIKMVGTRRDLSAEQDRFLEFCRSLRA